MEKHLLVFSPITDDSRRFLSERFTLHDIQDAGDDRRGFLATCSPQICAIVTEGPRPIDAAMIGAMPKLEIICCMSSGTDVIDTWAAKTQGVAVTNGAGANAASVADQAFGHLLYLARQMPMLNRVMRENNADEHSKVPRGNAVYGKTLGIMGLGSIGMELAKRAAGFDMKVVYHNRNRRKDVDFDYAPNVLALAEAADHLILSCPGNAETRNAVDGDILAALGPTGVLVNAARGMIVETAALIDALQTGKILGAGLDTLDATDAERKILCGLENVSLSPHTGGNTDEALAAKNALMQEIIAGHFAGKAVRNRIA